MSDLWVGAVLMVVGAVALAFGHWCDRRRTKQAETLQDRTSQEIIGALIQRERDDASA